MHEHEMRTGKPYPSAEDGSKISGRWATIVLARAEEAQAS